jgi:Phage Mu protein F like protein
MTLAGGVPLYENGVRISDRQRIAYVRYLRKHGFTNYGEGQLGSPAHGIIASILSRGATRVTAINETTRKELRALIAQAVDAGLGPAEAGDLIQAATQFSEYRAERIARTELTAAYNAAALQSYGTYGVGRVEASDGDEDEECAQRDGQVYSVDEAMSIEDHPNGTLDWLPITGG